MQKPRIRILLVDDHQLFRKAIRHTIEGNDDLTVVGEAKNGRDAVQVADEVQPDVILLDFAMPGLNGRDAAQQILQRCPSTRIIALSGHSDQPTVRKMLDAGASGYLTKDCSIDVLEQAIFSVAQGQTYLDPKVAGYFEMPEEGDEEDTRPKLTNREREVLQLYSEGNSTRQIGTDLGVSIKTVETHRSHIMEKLGLRTIAELTRYAIQEGITSLDH